MQELALLLGDAGASFSTGSGAQALDLRASVLPFSCCEWIDYANTLWLVDIDTGPSGTANLDPTLETEQVIKHAPGRD